MATANSGWRLIFLMSATLVAPLAFSQSDPASAGKFEIADIHASARTTTPAVHPFDNSAYAPDRMKGGLVRGGIYHLRTASMVDLIRTAWAVDAENVVGGPAWLERDRFDVIARTSATATPELLATQLKQLLAERFHLVAHQDTRPVEAWALTADKRTQLKASGGIADGTAAARCESVPQPASANEANRGGAPANSTFSCHNMTMAAFVEFLRGAGSASLGATPVADQTGLTGPWDFSIQWTTRANAASSDSISLFDALDKQLGLKLTQRQLPMPVVVVDRVDRQPTPNSPEAAKILPAPPLEFEVADVKPSMPGAARGGGGVLPGGRIEMRRNSMQDFIKFAWNIDDNNDDMLVGGPKWLDVDNFDIVAKAAVGQSGSGEVADVDTLRPMMQKLLADRFRLTTHYGTEPISVYVLATSKRALKLKKADPTERTACRSVNPAPGGGGSQASLLTRGVDCRNTTMAEFVEFLQEGKGSVDHPVVDATGLEGAWDFSFTYTNSRANRGGANAGAGAELADPNGAVTLFEALDRQLGLKLELQKRPMQVLVVDHVEQKPTDN